MAEYASLDYDISGGKRLAVTVDRGTGELQAFALDKDAVVSGTVQLVASGVERAQVYALPDTRWAAFYNIGTALYARVSEDGGATWGAQETLPVTLIGSAPTLGTARFHIAYASDQRLFGLVYAKLVSGTACLHLSAVRRDSAGTWTAGTETNLAGADLSRGEYILAAVNGPFLPLGNGRLFNTNTGARLGFLENFSWSSPVSFSYTLASPASLTPRYGAPIRAVRHQGSAILMVGSVVGRSTVLAPFGSTNGWASCVVWPTGPSSWYALRDSGIVGPPPLVSSDPANYIALGPATFYATGPLAAAGYVAACGQLRTLPDGTPELLYHARSGDLAFIRNRMTAVSYYPDPTQPGYANYLTTYWATSRRDTWE